MSKNEFYRAERKWSFSVKFSRILWKFFFQPIVMLLPKQLSVVRIFVLKIFGAKIGSSCLIMPGVKVLMPWELVLGNYVSIGEGVDIYNFTTVSIGDKSIVSQYTYLCTGSHDFEDFEFPLISKEIFIGSNCWVASCVFIGLGVAIADGVVVGAKSVVLKSIEEPWSVWGGYPAKKIKNRNSVFH